MSTPSSSARLPPTSPQVTASVVKFRCLYTHDLRRKSKRWHDGYLRYHKFNKRVMVYDDQGNFIGDHHWRSNDEVQDGDEMELDKGVLIEVTENMGTTETDITTLYEKKISSQGSPQDKDPVSQVPRASTYTSTSASASAPLRSSAGSQSFRSLNDLLGIKRTPIGHLVSPYESRNPPQPAASSIQEPERPPKRQKTSSVVNRNAEKGSRAQSEVIDLTASTDSNQGLPAKRSNQVVKELPRAGGDSTADVLSADCEQRLTVPPKQTRPQRPNPPSLSRVSVPTGSEPISSLLPSEVVHTATKGVQPPRPLGPSSKGPLPTLAAETEMAGPRGNLRLEQPPLGRENRPRPVSRPIPPQRSDPPTVSRTSLPIAPNQSSATLSTLQPPVRVVSNYEKPIGSTNNQTSTNVPPPADVPPSVNVSSSTKMPPPSRPSSALRPGAPTTALRMGTGKPRRKLMYSALLPSTSRTPSPATSDTPPASATREPATNIPEQQLAAGPDDSERSNEEFMPSTSTQFIFDEMIDGSGFKSSSGIKRLTRKRSLDSPLRKSISDPTTLTGRQARAGESFHAANTENEPREQGPWTSEALDLFDFWPAGRAKPND
ncbi:Protein of unknown function DUF2439 [Penicillium camemberti]|uniref:5'-3' DNA helicase ZGRF1-like N-terminal domain-containing protein n=1 Tax=Penicillium camemberti (strain FM 013) TaxID=1429867 RepID=A0A0G4PXY5_PENC3|nr:Protein of unknown function DUF2439 [Penicillium camemberti]